MNPIERPWPQESAEAPAPSTPPLPDQTAPPGLRKMPLLAGILSLFPGLGQVYDGLYLRGAVLFLIFASLIALGDTSGQPIFGLGIAFTVCFSVLDAYRQALLINYGYARDFGLSDLPPHLKAGQGGIIAGAILTLLGLLALAERFLVIDLSWLADLWPLGLVILGIWLIATTLRERRKRREGGTGL